MARHNIEKKYKEKISLLNPVMARYLRTYDGQQPFAEQISEIRDEELRESLENKLEKEGLMDPISLCLIDIPVRIYDDVYELDSVLELLRLGNGRAKEPLRNMDYFVYSDIQPAKDLKDRVQTFINGAKQPPAVIAPSVPTVLSTSSSSANFSLPTTPQPSAPPLSVLENRLYPSLETFSVSSPQPSAPTLEEFEAVLSCSSSATLQGRDSEKEASGQAPGVSSSSAPLPVISSSVSSSSSSALTSSSANVRGAKHSSEWLNRMGRTAKLKINPETGNRGIKLVVLGDSSCDKSGLLISYANNRYPEDYIPAVFDNYVVNLMAGQDTLELGLWDTSGQEEYDRLRPLTYANANVFIVLFSVVNPVSYESVSTKWIPDLIHFCPDVPTILVGCQIEKCGSEEVLEKSKKQAQQPITFEQGVKLAKRIKALKYMECSARTGEGLKQVFDEAVKASLGLAYERPSIINSFMGLFKSEDNYKDEEELIVCLKSYIEARGKITSSDGSEYSHLWGGFFGGIPSSIKVKSALDLVAKLAGANEKKFSEIEVEALLSGSLGEIVGEYPCIVEKNKR